MMRHSGLVVIKLIFVMPSPPPFLSVQFSFKWNRDDFLQPKAFIVNSATGRQHTLFNSASDHQHTLFLTVLQIAGTHFLRYQPGCYYYTMLRIKTLPLSPGYKWTREKKLAHISRYPPPPGGGGGGVF